MKVVDLSLDIKPHGRWKVEITKGPSTLDKGDVYEETSIKLGSHCYTHIDAPRHHFPEGRHMEDVPWDWLVGEAAVLNLSYKKDNEQITAQDLARAATHVRRGDKIILLRSDRELRYAIDTPEFFSTFAYLTRDAAEWLVEQGLKTIGYDFPGDYVLRDLGRRSPQADEFYTHRIILGNDMIQVEFLTNLHKITQHRTFVVVLPLKLLGSHDGAPCRVIAIEDWKDGQAADR